MRQRTVVEFACACVWFENKIILWCNVYILFKYVSVVFFSIYIVSFFKSANLGYKYFIYSELYDVFTKCNVLTLTVCGGFGEVMSVYFTGEMCVMQYCHNVIFESGRKQMGVFFLFFFFETTLDHESVFHVHGMAFQNVPYLLVGKHFRALELWRV